MQEASTKMKITMIGNTSSGKSCYMLCMYAFMSMGLNGFTLNATDPDQDIQLMDQWEELSEENNLPTATVAKSQDEPVYNYNFNFSYGAKPLINIEWIDYRGGALTSDSSSDDANVLRENARESDCLFLCVPADILIDRIVEEDGTVNDRAKLKAANPRRLAVGKVNSILSLIQKDIQQKQGKDTTIPIAILITKFDLICNKRSKDEITRDIKELFSLLFTPDSGWLTMICPFSLGKDITIEENEGKKKLLGEVNPIYVQIPLIFAIYSQLRKDAIDSEYALESTKQKLTDQQKEQKIIKSNFLNKIFKQDDFKRGNASISSSVSQMDKIEKEQKTIAKKMQLVSQELENVTMFLGDQEVKVNA